MESNKVMTNPVIIPIEPSLPKITDVRINVSPRNDADGGNDEPWLVLDDEDTIGSIFGDQ